jgi:hypothetical protein
MKRLTSTLICFLLFQTVYSQGKTFRTSTYAGTYGIGNIRSDGGGASIEVYPESDSTVLFYVHIQKGVPSHNTGRLYGRMKVINGSGVFNTQFDFLENACTWKVSITPQHLTLSTINNQFDCGFGNAVIADGAYKKISSKKPEYFVQGDGKRVYFSKVKPEQYNDAR